MLKTFKGTKSFIVDVPYFVSYDDESTLDLGDIAYALQDDSNDGCFVTKTESEVIAALKSLPYVDDAKLYDSEGPVQELEYDPAVPMWTTFMPVGYEEKLSKEVLEYKLLMKVRDATWGKDYDEASRLLEQLRAL